MKFKIKGKVLFEKWQNFEMEVNGNSENHAKHKIYSCLGGSNSLKRNKIKIEFVEMVN